MKYIIVTHVDADTKVPCTVAPMRTGPSFPELAGLQIQFDDHSRWPLSVIDGIYDKPPHFYGTCDDSADTTMAGVLGVITEAEFNTAKSDEEFTRTTMRLSRQVQDKLDRFAIERGYDNILSACSYASSGNADFLADAVRCIELRDATWTAVNAVFAAAKAGTRTLPQTFAELAPELPALVW